jgi:hypothetical protein
MCILASVNAHLWKPKCAYTKGKMCIYGRELPYMHIYRRKKCAFIEKKMCMEALFHISTFFLLYMRIYRSQNVHIRKLSSVYRASIYAHLQNPKCTYTEDRMRIYGIYLPYMRILASAKMRIYGR